MGIRDKIAEVIEGVVITRDDGATVEITDAGELSDAIIAALPSCVPDLKWECIYEYNTIERAKSQSGYYTATQDEDSASGRVFLEFHLTQDGDCMMGAIELKHDCYEPEDWREAANAHNRTTIMKAFGVQSQPYQTNHLR